MLEHPKAIRVQKRGFHLLFSQSRSFRPRFAVPVLVAVAALVFAGCGGSDDEQWDGETITIGSIFSTSGDGVAFGPQQLKAAQLAIGQINDDGGIEGAKLELAQRNDNSEPSDSVKQMKSLIDLNSIAVLGPTFSNQAAAADPVANKAGMPVLAVSNTGPGIVGDCPYPCEFIFRDSLGEAEAIPANIKTLVEAENPKTAAIVHPADDAFGESSAVTAKQAFEANGVKVNTVARSTAALLLALNTKPDVFMITASSGESATDLIKSLRRNGFSGPILGGNAFNSTTSSTIAGTDGKGAQSAAAWYSGNDSEENQKFIQDYKSAYGEAPDQFAAQSYTGVELLAEALEETDMDFNDIATSRSRLAGELAKVKEETPLGDFSFTADHDVSQPIWIVQMDGNGGFDLVKEIPAKAQ